MKRLFLLKGRFLSSLSLMLLTEDLLMLAFILFFSPGVRISFFTCGARALHLTSHLFHKNLMNRPSVLVYLSPQLFQLLHYSFAESLQISEDSENII